MEQLFVCRLRAFEVGCSYACVAFSGDAPLTSFGLSGIALGETVLGLWPVRRSAARGTGEVHSWFGQRLLFEDYEGKWIACDVHFS